VTLSPALESQGAQICELENGDGGGDGKNKKKRVRTSKEGTAHQARISSSIHGFPKVSLGPVMPWLTTLRPAGDHPLNCCFRGGRRQGGHPAIILLLPGYPIHRAQHRPIHPIQNIGARASVGPGGGPERAQIEKHLKK
jgi:hypothetical protein